ncbi:MAG: type II secretion system major pseudopilin GspG [Synergistaceae bacterium]|nr:type II secretion system major pseudopilin GspG [Synergistaceae bacterium]
MQGGGKHGGFTLVEIMVVVVIIGMLAAIIGPRLIGQSEQAKVTATKTQITKIEQSLELFHLNNGFFPTTQQGLKALIEKPTTPPEPRNYQRGGYLNSRTLPKDAWGNEYIYVCPGERGDYDIISLGADGKEGGEDNNADITNG